MKNVQVLNHFWQRLSASKQSVLLLDYDGTLAPFCVERDQAKPYDGIREILIAIRNDTATRMIIVSGRGIDDLLPLLGLDPPPEIWGCHGWERLDADGQRTVANLPQPAAAGLREAERWIENEDLASYCEHKPTSLALHWRGLPDYMVEELQSRTSNGWQTIALRSGLELHPFNGGLELRCPDRNKGTAIQAILAELEPDMPIAFLGDDLTDEDGFASLSGKGLSILVHCEPRKTYAELIIKPPDELIDFLNHWYDHAPRKILVAERCL